MTANPAPCNPPFIRPVLIAAGPTASGKSARALEIAQKYNGVIINADAMQCYRELRILTARPSDHDLALAPHTLYGSFSAFEPPNAASWREQALIEIETALLNDQIPILCGGSGMYLHALINGIAPIPAPDPVARETARALLLQHGPAMLHKILAENDPKTALKLRPSDGQRIARAHEIWLSTGRPLSEWQEIPGTPAPYRFAAICLDPPREQLRAAIGHRFTGMIAEGAVREVQALLALNFPEATPILRAHGVPELKAYLSSNISLAQACADAVKVTSQYTKRQATWFRHHALATAPLNLRLIARFNAAEQFSENITAFLDSFFTSNP